MFHTSLKSVTRLGLTNKRQISFRLAALKPDFTKFALKEQPPGYIVGTVNDAFVPPAPEHNHGSYHWAYERATTLAMIPLSVLPFVSGTPYPMLDAIFSTLLVVHCKAGFQSCIIDYIPKRVYGAWHTMAMYLLNLGTGVSLYGVFLLETQDNGLFDFIQRLWAA